MNEETKRMANSIREQYDAVQKEVTQKVTRFEAWIPSADGVKLRTIIYLP